MDIATLLGLIAEILILFKAAGSNLAATYGGIPLLIVLAGGIAATFIAFPLRSVAGLPVVLIKTLFSRTPSHHKLIETIVGFAETARREGILALEKRVGDLDDPFLATGIRLAVDGTEPELIQIILETELNFIEDRHRSNQNLVRTLGINFGVFGGVGALIVLVLQSGAESGLALISGAALPLLYGLLLYGLFAVALRQKLVSISEYECLQKRMSMEGVMSIQSGDNPRIVEQKLNVFIAPDLRINAEPPPKPAPPPERKVPEEIPQDETLVQQVTGVMQRLQAGLPDEVKASPEKLNLETMLKHLPDETQKEILAFIADKSAPPASPWTFVFDDLARLTDRELQMILREVDTKDLAIALKGAGRELQNRIFSNISERVGNMIKEEMAYSKPVNAEAVIEVQLRIMHIVRLLQEAGQVSSLNRAS